MKYLIAILLILLALIHINAQVVDSLNQPVSPKGGINQLAIEYYDIEFSKTQREEIEDIEIEFIFSIDPLGKPTLAEINGISNPDIVDSLKTKTAQIERFNPQIINGIAVPSIYFMKLTFPSYQYTQHMHRLLHSSSYAKAKIEDFEYISESGQRLDMIIGGMVNQFIGNPSKHLALGGGMKIDLSYAGKNNLLYGLNMGVYGNKLKNEYPINTTREQNNAPPSLLIGGVFGKWFDNFNLQSELNYVVQNITEKIGDNDPDWVQLRGWSPGLVINYPIKLGRSKPIYYYGEPSLLENNLNIHLGIRYIKLSLKEATGMMLELGLSYRMAIKNIEEYKLKEDLPTLF